MRLAGRRFDSGQPITIQVEGNAIAAIGSLPPGVPEGADLPWVAPALFDIQVNGYGGQEFASPQLTPEKVRQIADVLARLGVVRFCPTVTTQASDVLLHAMRTLAQCMADGPWARRMPGIHLEGPYITREDGARGAHPLEHCRPPDWDEFQRLQEAADGRIRILTMSPEYENAEGFIRRVAATGVVVAIGHTAAHSDQIRRAVDAGARLSTHLGNGSHPMLRRHPNYIWDQLAEDRLTASLIVDGHHLPPAVVKCFVRMKTPDRTILVSDLSGMAGLPPGRYQTQLTELEILPEGRLVVAGQREILAGAYQPLPIGIPNVMHFAGVDLATAVRMATDNPARLLGLHPGGLQPGDPADLVLFDLLAGAGPDQPGQFVIRTVLIAGQSIPVG